MTKRNFLFLEYFHLIDLWVRHLNDHHPAQCSNFQLFLCPDAGGEMWGLWGREPGRGLCLRHHECIVSWCWWWNVRQSQVEGWCVLSSWVWEHWVLSTECTECTPSVHRIHLQLSWIHEWVETVLTSEWWKVLLPSPSWTIDISCEEQCKIGEKIQGHGRREEV